MNKLMYKRTCIIVLGMHRSGTSALAGMLYNLGIPMGKELLEPAPDNPKGFYENKRITAFNDQILLSEIGTRWDDVLPFSLEKISKNNSLKEKALTILEEDYKNEFIFGIKDPRMCILLPFWQEIIKTLEVEIKILFLYRNPLEVAYSLFHRNGFSLGKGLILWAKYNLYAEYHSRRFKRMFISYQDLLYNPLYSIKKIEESLDISFPKLEKDEIIKFLEKKLKKFAFSNNHLPENIPSFIKDSAFIFEKLTKNGKDSIEIRQKLDSLRKEYEKNVKYLYEDLLTNKDLRIEIYDDTLNCLFQQVKPTRKSQEFFFDFQGISFNPAFIRILNRPCIVELNDISIISKEGREININDFNTNAVVVRDNIYVFGADPQIFIWKLPYSEVRGLKVKLRYLNIGESVVSEFERIILELEQQKLDLQKQKEDIENELINLYLSNSWQFMRPFRKIRHFISKILKA